MATKKTKAKAPGRRPVEKSPRKTAAKKRPAKPTLPAPSLTPPRLGEIWPGQGGRYVGDIRGLDGQPDRRLVVPVDPRAEITGAYGPLEKLKDAMSRRDGMANTRAMAKVGSPIAIKALKLKIEGHQDYYIAADDESKIAAVNRPDGFPGVDRMWTSTQSAWNDAFAWVQLFVYGIQFVDHKSNEYRAFILRSVPIQ